MADMATDMTDMAAVDSINLMNDMALIGKDQVHQYRLALTEGQSMTIQIQPMAGDPDLYVWFPHPAAAAYLQGNGTRGVNQVAAAPDVMSNGTAGSDQVSFTAPHTGEYLVEVHDYADSDYSLTATLNGGAAVPGHDHTKAAPTGPIVSGSPSNPVAPQAVFRAFLPVAWRDGN